MATKCGVPSPFARFTEKRVRYQVPAESPREATAIRAEKFHNDDVNLPRMPMGKAHVTQTSTANSRLTLSNSDKNNYANYTRSHSESDA